MRLSHSPSFADRHEGVAREKGVHETDELLHFKWLYEKRRGTKCLAILLIRFECLGTAHENPNIRSFRGSAQGAEDFDAVELRHHDVEQQEIGTLGACAAEALLAVARQLAAVARVRERAKHVFSDFLDILANEDAAF